jgi:hypothetical protein
MVLPESAEFLTGPHSYVTFALPPDQFITVDRLGKVKVVKAIEQDGKLTTNIGMTYGKTRYTIEDTGREHEATISSPNSTLAVRGTDFLSKDEPPFAPQAASYRGRVEFRDLKNNISTSVGSKNKNQGKTTIKQGDHGAAESALAASAIDPNIALARSDAEAPLVDTLLSRGAVFGFDRERGIPTVSGGFPPTQEQIPSILPGRLDFVLTWTGNADLDLSASAPGNGGKGEFIYPVGSLATSPSGGHTAFDHLGGPHGGIEIIYWQKNFPIGPYGLGVTSVSGVTTPATIQAFLDGKNIPLTNFTNGYQNQLNTTVQSGGTAAAFVPVGIHPPPVITPRR